MLGKVDENGQTHIPRALGLRGHGIENNRPLEDVKNKFEQALSSPGEENRKERLRRLLGKVDDALKGREKSNSFSNSSSLSTAASTQRADQTPNSTNLKEQANVKKRVQKSNTAPQHQEQEVSLTPQKINEEQMKEMEKTYMRLKESLMLKLGIPMSALNDSSQLQGKRLRLTSLGYDAREKNLKKDDVNLYIN